MEHKGLIQKLKSPFGGGRGGQILIAGGLFSIAAISLTLGMRVGRRPGSPSLAQSRSDPTPAEPPGQSFFSGIVDRYAHLFADIQAQVEDLERADEENDRLREENAHLRLLIESARFEKEERQAEETTRSLELRLRKKTGSRVGRPLDALAYQIPRNLMPAQLHELALHYFRSGEDEKASVLLNFLTGLESDTRFRTPTDFLLTGISWYRLENYKRADSCFDKAMNAPGARADRAIQSQLRLWKALTAERMNQHRLAQRWLWNLFNYDPHAREAAWVNPLDGGFRRLHRDKVKREPAERKP